MGSWLEAAEVIGPFLGAVISLVGFALLIRQLKINKLTVENQARGLIYQLSNSVYKLFVDHPELRPFFYDSVPIPLNEPGRSKVLAVAELLTDFFENIVHAADVLDPEVRDTWFIYMGALYTKSPALQSFFEERKSDYTHRLQKVILAKN